MINTNTHRAIMLLKERGFTTDKLGNIINPKGKTLMSKVHKSGYYKVCVRFDRRKSFSIGHHKFIAYLKYGDVIFEQGVHIRHKNTISTDNSWDNILIGSASDNNMDKSPEVRMRAALIATSAVRKYDKQTVKEYYNTNGWKQTLEFFKISSTGTLSYILNS